MQRTSYRGAGGSVGRGANAGWASPSLTACRSRCPRADEGQPASSSSSASSSASTAAMAKPRALRHVAGGRDSPGRADNWGDRHENALDVRQCDPRVHGRARVDQVGQWWGVRCGQGRDASQHQLARLEARVLERRCSHRRERVEQRGVVSHVGLLRAVERRRSGRHSDGRSSARHQSTPVRAPASHRTRFVRAASTSAQPARHCVVVTLLVRRPPTGPSRLTAFAITKVSITSDRIDWAAM